MPDQLRDDTDQPRVLSGIAASPGVVDGVARVLELGSAAPVGEGDVLVVLKTTPTMTPALISAKAVVSESGGLVSHAAVVARELGIPCVVGCEGATTLIQDGAQVTVDGDRGLVTVQPA
ncbi:MAG TPA: PEP-utilizing enzyme [Natronosporangium sp.]